MSDCTCDQCPPPTVDPHKRVKYTRGLVMGVDEFLQEQVYLLEDDRIRARGLHGYGTALGLDVTVVDDGSGPTVRVEPGLALDPYGRDICVHSAQCARLQSWIDANADELRGATSLPDAISVYVVLCHRECETDFVPLPGGPCKTQDDTMAASRIADDFQLKLLLEAPPHVEEGGVRAFGRLLRLIEIADTPGSLAQLLTEDELLDQVRALANDGGPASLPEGPLLVPTADAADMLRAAWRVWVTEVRPHLMGDEGCASPAEGDDCLLLAELRFELEDLGGGLGIVVPTGGDPVEVNQDDRPYLLTTRLLQEWMIAGGWSVGGSGGASGEAGGDLDGDYPDPTVVRLQGNDISTTAPTTTGQVLGWNDPASQWEPRSMALGPATDDVSGTYPALTVVALQGSNVSTTAPTTTGQVLGWNDPASQWEPRSTALGPATDDVSGTYPALTVVALQGRDVSAATPTTDGQVLTWDRAQSHWEPRAAPSGDTDVGNKYVHAVDPRDIPYAIVGAGFFTITSRRQTTVSSYNDLKVVGYDAGTGEISFNFAGYKQPLAQRPKRMYVVKGTVADNTDDPLFATFQFVRFDVDFFVVRVRGLSVSDGELRLAPPTSFRLMVEVSGYGDLELG